MAKKWDMCTCCEVVVLSKSERSIMQRGRRCTVWAWCAPFRAITPPKRTLRERH